MIPVKVDSTAEAADIPTMRAMTDADYANWLEPELFYFDHHEVLRMVHGGYPLAATPGQVRELIKYLRGIEAKMKAAER